MMLDELRQWNFGQGDVENLDYRQRRDSNVKAVEIHNRFDKQYGTIQKDKVNLSSNEGTMRQPRDKRYPTHKSRYRKIP